ncbi:Endonuclease/exonuclease/phosphatase [Geopyxis carbonaria]|nr:Endonuclease/exonuclease/phosphatase [Geopyxis carbonaria]
MAIKVLVNDSNDRSIALVTNTHALFFKQSAGSKSKNISVAEKEIRDTDLSQCAVEFSEIHGRNFDGYIPVSARPCFGCLGLVSLGGDVFLCVITSAREVAAVRPHETVSRIYGVEYYCVNRTGFDHLIESEVNTYPVELDPLEPGRGQQATGWEHPCLPLRKLLSDGTFYYSREFDLTNRLQDRAGSIEPFDIASFDRGFMWNSHMLDDSRILTCVIRGFVESLTIQRPISRNDSRGRIVGLPGSLTLISRLSCRRAGTRFNSRGIDDDGHVANFVETETIIWSTEKLPNTKAIGFSYCQIRGSIPIFWEQQTGLLPNQQKIHITRSREATQPAFEKHMEGLVLKYGAAHILNLLSETKTGEVELSTHYRYHISASPLFVGSTKSHQNRYIASLLRSTEYDFHAETKGSGYEAASYVKHLVKQSLDGFGYFLIEDSKIAQGDKINTQPILQQEGIFRTNCLDCLDRTNLIQGILSRACIESFLDERGQTVGQEFWPQHSALWADNGDALSKIYAGTGALKSSFTRSGKMSWAGAIADARKSATRMYINNFADKDRQNTIDILLGRIVGQETVRLHDPINDFVVNEMSKRAEEYTLKKQITIYAGTFNLNGQTAGIHEDLSEWLKPTFNQKLRVRPDIVVVGFQEIVELSPQQIMSTDPMRRQLWENAVLKCLNKHEENEYILLRGGQLVGAALLIFVRSSEISCIKNVEGGLKKTGMSGVAGNKGAVAVRLEYASTRLCFVTAHLAAGFSNTDERNRDYATISNGLRFQMDRQINDHDAIIWLGDFNYRIGLPDDKVRNLIKMGDLQTLYENDQLHLQMVAGLAFSYYREGIITFNPTYKFDIGVDTYDTSEKARIPAWCDRILWKGNGLRQVSYGSSSVRISDHRPVFAIFECSVSIVNEQVKEYLKEKLYKQQQNNKNGESKSCLDADNEDNDDLLELQPLSTGLPPPSSERQKWWLNDGLPAKSTIQVPPSGQRYHQQPVNPFKESNGNGYIQSDHKTYHGELLDRNQSDLSPQHRNLQANIGHDNSGSPCRSTVGLNAISSYRDVTPGGGIAPKTTPHVPKKPIDLAYSPQKVSSS